MTTLQETPCICQSSFAPSFPEKPIQMYGWRQFVKHPGPDLNCLSKPISDLQETGISGTVRLYLFLYYSYFATVKLFSPLGNFYCLDPSSRSENGKRRSKYFFKEFRETGKIIIFRSIRKLVKWPWSRKGQKVTFPEFYHQSSIFFRYVLLSILEQIFLFWCVGSPRYLP